ncbi:MAG: hypothetical protein WC889_15620, partial [Myxococcota bacterium]
TDTIGQWKVQFESGFDFATFRSNGARTKLLSGAPTKVRLGLHERIELFVETDAFVYDIVDRNGKTKTSYGFADLAPGIKFAFFKGGGLWGLEPSSTLHLWLVMPTGNQGFTLDTWAPKAVLAFSWNIPSGIEARANIGSMLLDNKGERYHQGVFGVAFQRDWAPLTSKVGSFVEVYGTLAFSDAAVTTAVFNGGFFFIANDRMRVDVSCRARLYGDGLIAPEVAGGFGFTIKL